MNKQQTVEEMSNDISSYIHKKDKRTMLIITDSETSVHRRGLSEHFTTKATERKYRESG